MFSFSLMQAASVLLLLLHAGAAWAATADHLVFAQQPADAAEGAKLSPAVTVQVVDINGNPVADAGRSITVSLNGTGVLSGTAAVQTDASGLAAFNDLSINLSGAKNLTAASAGTALGSVVSNAFNIIGAADHLVFIQQPVTALAGSPIVPAVTVQVVDANGSPVADAGRSITLSLTGKGKLSGTTACKTNASGLAVFSGLRIDMAGSKNLTASGLGVAVSNAFPIAGAADHLVFIQQPATVAAGAQIAPAVTVQVADANGNPVADAGRSVTVSLIGKGKLSGTATVQTNASGLASFGGLSVDVAGVKNLMATGLGVVASQAFNILGAADRLVFVQQPTAAAAGARIAPAVTVQVTDASGNPVTAAGRTIAVSLTGKGKLSGMSTAQTNASGLATFSDLSIDVAGSKNLTATDTTLGLSAAVSNAFKILAGAARDSK